jgi:aspartyl-tRNA(Asn)/glutamyl-tRNA(Gln) amidotransferase subunit C
MRDILAYWNPLCRDHHGREPLYGPVTHVTPPGPTSQKDQTRDEVLANAPESDGRFFIVPRIV